MGATPLVEHQLAPKVCPQLTVNEPKTASGRIFIGELAFSNRKLGDGFGLPKAGIWCRLTESNRRPSVYKTAALPAELSRPGCFVNYALT